MPERADEKMRVKITIRAGVYMYSIFIYTVQKTTIQMYSGRKKIRILPI